MELIKDERGITLSQVKYAKKILEKYRMDDCRPTSTPLELKKNKKESKVNTPTKKREKFPYREAVGSLQHLACKTRPDLAFAVNYVNRFVEKPSNEDINNVRRIFRYLKGNTELGLYYSSGNHIRPTVTQIMQVLVPLEK